MMEPDNLHPLKGKVGCMIKLITTDMDGTLLDERVVFTRVWKGYLDHLDQKGFGCHCGGKWNRMPPAHLESFGQAGDWS